MLQTQDPPSPPTCPDRTGPTPLRGTPPPLPVVELADADDFRRLAQRHLLRCRRDGRPLSTLIVQAHADPAIGEAQRLQLLAECARRLRSRVRSTDVVACWHGTHFGVLLPHCEPQHAEAVRLRLLAHAGGPYRLAAQLLALDLHGAAISVAAP